MKNIIITADVIFFNSAKKGFNFPIKNSIRTSFWLFEDKASTFSEVQFFDNQIEPWVIYRATVKIGDGDFLQGRIAEGVEFKLGLYPFEFAIGRIVDIVKESH